MVAFAAWAMLLLGALISPVLVSGADNEGPGGNSTTTVIKFPNPLGNCAPTGNQLQCVIYLIIDKLILLSIPIVSALVIFAAYQIMTSAGDPEKFKTGTKTLLYTAIGFAIILASKGVALLLQDILKS